MRFLPKKIVMRFANIFLTIIFIGLFASGCATVYNPATEKKEFIFIDTSSEVSLGRNIDLQVRSQYKISKDKRMVKRLHKIAGSIAAVSDRQDLKYEFNVLAGKEINAFAIPGGFIYVFAGLMDKTTDDELACVIAHEIGHVAARHIVKKLQAQMGYELLMGFAFSSGKPQDMQRAVNFTFNVINLGYSREDEMEADRLSVKYAYASGRNPRAMISFLRKLESLQRKGILDQVTIFRTHPQTNKRIEHLEKLIQSYPASYDDSRACPECKRHFSGKDKFCPYDGNKLENL